MFIRIALALNPSFIEPARIFRISAWDGFTYTNAGICLEWDFPPPPHRHLLRQRRHAEPTLLRQPRGCQTALDQRGWVLRLPHQHPTQPQEETTPHRRPDGIRRLLQPRKPPQAPAHLEPPLKPRRPLAQIHLRRTHRPRQNQPRPLLAQGQKPHRPRQPPRARPASRRNHRKPRSWPKQLPRRPRQLESWKIETEGGPHPLLNLGCISGLAR